MHFGWHLSVDQLRLAVMVACYGFETIKNIHAGYSNSTMNSFIRLYHKIKYILKHYFIYESSRTSFFFIYTLGCRVSTDYYRVMSCLDPWSELQLNYFIHVFVNTLHYYGPLWPLCVGLDGGSVTDCLRHNLFLTSFSLCLRIWYHAQLVFFPKINVHMTISIGVYESHQSASVNRPCDVTPYLWMKCAIIRYNGMSENNVILLCFTIILYFFLFCTFSSRIK